MALLRNYGTDKEQNKAIGNLMKEEYGIDFSAIEKRPEKKTPDFYFGNGHFEKSTFPFQFKQNWKEFIGALTTASYMPDEDHPLFDKFETEAKKIFSHYSEDGYLTVKGETELIIGQPSK